MAAPSTGSACLSLYDHQMWLLRTCRVVLMVRLAVLRLGNFRQELLRLFSLQRHRDKMGTLVHLLPSRLSDTFCSDYGVIGVQLPSVCR